MLALAGDHGTLREMARVIASLPELEPWGLGRQAPGRSRRRCAARRMEGRGRGSRFYLCEFSERDPRFPRYPTLPVLECGGVAPQATTGVT